MVFLKNTQKFYKSNNYAEINHFTGIVEEIEIDPDTHPGWFKIRKYFEFNTKYEWIWYLDGDAFLMSTESILDIIDETKSSRIGLETDIIISKDCGKRVNSGSFIVRTSKWTNMFFKKWTSYENNTLLPNRDIFWEQAALQYMIEKNVLEVNDHLAIVDQKKINAYIWDLHCGYEYVRGDLVLHAPARGYAALCDFLDKQNLTEV